MAAGPVRRPWRHAVLAGLAVAAVLTAMVAAGPGIRASHNPGGELAAGFLFSFAVLTVAARVLLAAVSRVTRRGPE